MRIGFLFNHDQIHQVAHSLPIALALADANTGAQIVVATTNARLTAEVVRMCGDAIGKVKLVQLGLTTARSRLLSRSLGALLPAAKLLVYGDNLDFFRSLDVLRARSPQDRPHAARRWRPGDRLRPGERAFRPCPGLRRQDTRPPRCRGRR